ncbi:hypothetical protein M430DRAFT_176518 [Amorphotheca resinae ATCC 22711]|uniref:Uncharacterized protein n=1 Tax=Amorphotheca resinae ATCC 22711 TaxID=857342 RepID=A0A2T3AT04_AMORE|nr:hypothetical protein M430DRAFT_176518 [Amorphotheca resinae ATCC 22711]PSS10592.1 hypothetical protein M430DRAFT_176518 [Amorphotheca resinae ATCC 22711]
MSRPTPLETFQRKTDSNTDRIHHWIHTGEHKFVTSSVESKANGSTIWTETIGHDAIGKAVSVPSKDIAEPSPGSASSYLTGESITEQNSEPEPVELLVGCEDDLLIPSTDQINCTFLRCQNIWRAYVAGADSLASGCMPAETLDPYILMQDVPPLPQDLHKKKIIKGRALWHVPCPELPTSCRGQKHDDNEIWNPEHVYGVEKTFYLWTDKPTKCGISSRPDFRHGTSGEQPSGNSPNGLAILILCWSYILSVRLLEMQKRRIQYSSTISSPLFTEDVRPQSSEIVIHLGHASKELVRWLRAVLAQSSGWFVKGRMPPWTAHYEGDIRFIIATALPFTEFGNEKPPSSSEAADLLVEFCGLYPFGSQPTAAFLAALMLPFHNERDLQPQLPMPRIAEHPKIRAAASERIREFVNDLPYFMTLSISPRYLGSAIWSIFWEPGVQCNLASSWLGSIHQMISPILETGDIERLAKIFALRRPRLAPLWLGMFLCGCPEVIDMIRSYLQSLEEQPYDGSWARPDPDVAVWTGSRQSFFDEDGSGPYLSQNAQVPRADLFRHRFNFRLGDGADIIHFGWQPFGTVKKTEIEPELWPRLECKPQPRKYIHWVWWLAENKSVIERGLRHDKGKHTDSVAEELDSASSTVVIPSGFHCDVRLEPSKQATFRILDWGSKMASGERSIEAVAIPGIRQHPWLADAREIA